MPDIPVPADYDADGHADIAVFRPTYGAWFVNRSSNGADVVTTFGISGDRHLALVPAVQNAYYP